MRKLSWTILLPIYLGYINGRLFLSLGAEEFTVIHWIGLALAAMTILSAIPVSIIRERYIRDNAAACSIHRADLELETQLATIEADNERLHKLHWEDRRNISALEQENAQLRLQLQQLEFHSNPCINQDA